MTLRHASIDAATRAARGLPEDLIRLCVGIEDSHDLVDDLERALLAAGAIEFDEVQNKYVRVAETEGMDAITRAVQQLAVGDELSDATREWLVSAPGKVILFGEHAVVHGVVSAFVFCFSLASMVLFPCSTAQQSPYGRPSSDFLSSKFNSTNLICSRLLSPPQLISGAMV